MPKMFTKLGEHPLILEVRISKLHLEVVTLSLIIYLECEEVMHVEGERKRRPKKAAIVDFAYAFSVIGR